MLEHEENSFSKQRTNQEIKQFKINIDNITKSIIEQKNSMETNLKQFIINSIQTYNAGIKSELEGFQEELKNTKLSNGKYHIEILNIVKEFKYELELYYQKKNEILAEWHTERAIFKETTNLCNVMKKDFRKGEKAHSEFEHNIKVNRLYII